MRANPGLRAAGRPDPFEALAWAVCEQLIEYERAAAIQRRLVARLGRRCAVTGLTDSPTAAVLAAQAPALLESFGLTETRALALVRLAREVAAARVDLADPDHERGWRRLLASAAWGPGRSRRWRSPARAGWISSPRAILPTSRWWGGCTRPIPAPGPPRTRSARCSPPTRPGQGWRGLHALHGAGSAAALRLAA